MLGGHLPNHGAPAGSCPWHFVRSFRFFHSRHLGMRFCLFGGLWGMMTHLFAVSIGIVCKPPVLQGAAPVVAVVMAIFEFMFY